MSAPVFFQMFDDHADDPFIREGNLKFVALDPEEKKYLTRRFDDFLPHEDEILIEQARKKYTPRQFSALADEWFTTPKILMRRMMYLTQ